VKSSVIIHIAVLTLTALLLVGPTAAALPGDELREPDPRAVIQKVRQVADYTYHELTRLIDETTGPEQGAGGDDAPGTGQGGAPGLGSGFMDRLGGTTGVLVLSTLGIAALAGAGLFLATRYVDPKEAMKKPQRAMLYGYIKGNPGVNLKQLSEDFDMKTSTVLWHIRKLEAANLVRSQKANGLRVFYPVDGGMEAKRLGLAVAALSNANATTILDYIAVHPGTAQKNLVNALGINAGTIRWHLRKLKDVGLMAELSQGRMSTYYPTDLGLRALKQTHGLATEAKPVADLVREATATSG
jgi:predicted transcriptional regulator